MDSGVAMETNRRDDHICAKQAVCFQCFKAGMEKVRAQAELMEAETKRFPATEFDVLLRWVTLLGSLNRRHRNRW